MMTLTMNVVAVMVQLAVHAALLTLGDMAAVSGFITAHLAFDPRIALFIARRLAGGHLAVLEAVVDPVLLIILALVDLVNPGMTGIRLGEGGAGDQCAGDETGEEQGH